VHIPGNGKLDSGNHAEFAIGVFGALLQKGLDLFIVHIFGMLAHGQELVAISLVPIHKLRDA
jgi:hypothetical protein